VLNSDLDEVKPIAAKSWGGFVTMDGLLIGAYDEQWLGAYSLKTGQYVWWLKLTSPVSSQINMIGSWVVFGLRDGRILKVEGTTGEKVWESSIGFFSNQEFVLSGKKLLIPVINNRLFAVDFISGKKVWFYEGGSSDGLGIEGLPRPRLWGDKVVIGTTHGALHIVDLESGNLLAKVDMPSAAARFKDVVGDIGMESSDLLFTRYDGEVSRVSLASGRPLEQWRRALPGISVSRYVQGVYYIGCINGKVYALDGSSGDILWQTQTLESVSSFVVGANSVLVAGSEGYVSSLSASSGKLQWFDHLDANLDSRPVRFGDVIYYASGLKVLYGYKFL
tara:strand:+ start:1634 stop:2635 length:1002 start_codon:yes stop_codon:yes gene_type:complete